MSEREGRGASDERQEGDGLGFQPALVEGGVVVAILRVDEEARGDSTRGWGWGRDKASVAMIDRRSRGELCRQFDQNKVTEGTTGKRTSKESRTRPWSKAGASSAGATRSESRTTSFAPPQANWLSSSSYWHSYSHLSSPPRRVENRRPSRTVPRRPFPRPLWNSDSNSATRSVVWSASTGARDQARVAGIEARLKVAISYSPLWPSRRPSQRARVDACP